MRTELHTHLLPEVDDGPAGDAEALALARMVLADGTGTVVATPHVSMVRIAELPHRLERLRDVLADAGLGLAVRQGGELSPNDAYEIREDELESIAQGPPGRRWLLLEAPLSLGRTSLSAAAQELRARGYGVLVAHPERSPMQTIEELREHVRLGSILQVNASSLAGAHGARAERVAFEIVQSGLPFVVASDAHGPERPPLLGEAARVLGAAGLDAEAIRAAVDTGPGRLLTDGLDVEVSGQARRHRRPTAETMQHGHRHAHGSARRGAVSRT